MSIASIKTLIATESSICNIVGQVIGTPRTYGDRKSEDIWRTCVCNGQWKGVDALIDGMGAAVVGERRFFDAPKGKVTMQRYGFDDSCIYALLVGRFPFSGTQIDAVVDMFNEHSP